MGGPAKNDLFFVLRILPKACFSEFFTVIFLGKFCCETFAGKILYNIFQEIILRNIFQNIFGNIFGIFFFIYL